MKRRLAILPGSYDPMTLGHLELVRMALQDFEQVVVAVMVNPSKKTLFDMKTRVRIAELTVSELPNVRVTADRGMLIDLYDRLGADAVCKGVRDQFDYDYEVHMAEWNLRHNPRFRTELYRASEEYAGISSTRVRELLAEGKSPEGLVHPLALPLIFSQNGEKT